MNVNAFLFSMVAITVAGCGSTDFPPQTWGEIPAVYQKLRLSPSGQILNKSGEFVECIGRLDISNDLSYMTLQVEGSSLILPIHSQIPTQEPFPSSLLNGEKLLVVGRIDLKSENLPNTNIWLPALEDIAFVADVK